MTVEDYMTNVVIGKIEVIKDSLLWLSYRYTQRAQRRNQKNDSYEASRRKVKSKDVLLKMEAKIIHTVVCLFTVQGG